MPLSLSRDTFAQNRHVLSEPLNLPKTANSFAVSGQVCETELAASVFPHYTSLLPKKILFLGETTPQSNESDMASHLSWLVVMGRTGRNSTFHEESVRKVETTFLD